VARLFLDEDVSVQLAAILRARGISVLTTRDADRLGSSDEQQLAFAVVSNCTFVTHNRADFVALAQQYFQHNKPHDGIIIATRRRPSELATRILKLLHKLRDTDLRNQIIYI